MPESSSSWITPEALDILIPPEESREFRFSVSVPDDPSLEGTYHGAMFFRVVPPPTETSGIGVITTTRIGLIVYVTILSTEKNDSELVDFYIDETAENQALKLIIANNGNTLMRLGGRIELRDQTGESQFEIEVLDLAILRESEREITLALPENMPSGFYVALAVIEDSRGGLLAGELPFTLP